MIFYSILNSDLVWLFDVPKVLQMLKLGLWLVVLLGNSETFSS